MEVLQILAMAFGLGVFVIFFSAIVEAVVEYLFGIPADYVPWLTRNKGWMIPVVSIGIGILGAFQFRLDLFYIYGQFLEGALAEISGTLIAMHIKITTLGIILTGILLARGSNFVHEIFKRWFKLDTALKNWAVFGEPGPKN